MEVVCRLHLTIYPTENKGDPIDRPPGSLAPGGGTQNLSLSWGTLGTGEGMATR